MEVTKIQLVENRLAVLAPSHECLVGFNNGYQLSVAGSDAYTHRAAVAFEDMHSAGQSLEALFFLKQGLVVEGPKARFATSLTAHKEHERDYGCV